LDEIDALLSKLVGDRPQVGDVRIAIIEHGDYNHPIFIIIPLHRAFESSNPWKWGIW
jgi:hypothetical protein